MRIHRRWTIVCTLFAGFLSAQPHSDPAHSESKQRDIYAIYSAVMPGAVFANLGPGQNQRWAIADTTVNIDDMNPKLAPDAALKPPGYDPKPFQEALADFNARKYQRETLTPSLHLDRPYTLLSSADANEFRNALASATAGNATKLKYAGYPGVTYFSDVYFDAHRSAALVYMLDWCGSLCNQGEWIYLEKQNGRWIQRSGQAAVVSGAHP